MNQKAAERILKLLDEGSFVEIGAFVSSRENIAAQTNDGDGVVTGYGTISDALVYVYAQDPDVRGGSLGEMGARKISNIADMAYRMKAPLIALVDCAGVRLDEFNDSLFSFGRMFAHQAKLSGVVPQITAVFGSCGGGMAVAAAMSDFVFMESESGRLFVNSPNAIVGNYEEKCDTSSAVYQSEKTGICDFAGTEDEIFAEIRTLVSMLPENNYNDFSGVMCTDDLNRSVEGIDNAECICDAVRQIADDGVVFPVKRVFAPCVCTAFIRLNGRTVGVVANKKKKLCGNGCRKAEKMVTFCDAFGIPVLTLVNVERFCSRQENEEVIARESARLTYAYSSATVPSVTVITGDCFGTPGIIMNSKSIGADVVYAWNNTRMGLMDESILKQIGGSDSPEINSALFNARRGYIDDIIDPSETRQRVAAAFEMLYSKDVMTNPRKHGTV